MRRMLFFFLAAVFLAGQLALIAASAPLLGNTAESTLPERIVARLTAELAPFRTRIGGISFDWPSTLRLRTLSLSDDNGTWLTAEDILIVPDLPRLLRGHPALKRLSVSQVDMPRLPVMPPKPEDDQAPAEPGPLIPELPGLRVDELAVDRLSLGQAVAGTPMTLSVSGNADTLSASPRVALTVTDLGKGAAGTADEGEYVELDARVVHDASRADELALTLAVRESGGGPLGRLLGLPEGVAANASLYGQGPLADWSGALNATAVDYLDLNGQVGLSLEPGIDVSLNATAALWEGLWPEAAAERLGRTAAMDLRAGLHEGNEVVVLAPSRVAFEPAILNISGAYDNRNGTMDAAFDLNATEPARLLAGTDVTLRELRRFSGRVTGTVERPELALSAEAEGLALPGLTAGSAGMSLSALLLPDEGGPPGLAANGTMVLAELKLPDVPDLPGELQLAFDAATEDFRQLRLARLDLDAPDLTLTARGNVSLEPGNATDLNLEVVSADLARAPFLSASGLRGGLRINARARGDLAVPRLSVTGDASLERLGGLPPAVMALTGESPRLAFDADLEGQSVRLGEARLAEAPLALAATGRADLDIKRFTAGLNGQLPDSSRLGRALGVEMAGPLKLTASADGNFTGFSARTELSSPRLAAGTERFDDLLLRADASGLPDRARGRLDLTGKALSLGGGKTDPVHLATAYTYDASKGLLELSGLELSALDVAAKGEARLDIERLLATARLNAKAASLTRIGGVAGLPLTGSGSLDLTLAPANGKQGVNVDATVSSLSLPDQGLTVRSLDLDARGEDLFGTPTGKANLDLNGIAGLPVPVTKAGLTASGGLAGLDFDLKAEGPEDEKLDLAAAGRLARTDNATTVRLDTLNGRYRTLRAHLTEPATLSLSPSGAQLSRFALASGNGTLLVWGDVGNGRAQGQLQAHRLALAPFSLFSPMPLTGELTANGTLSGTTTAPNANLTLDLTGFAPSPQAAPRQTLRVRSTVGLGPSRLEARAEVRGLGDDPLTATASVPARFSLDPFLFELADDAPVSGDLKGPLDLARLSAVLGQNDMVLSGTARLDLGLGGTLAAPAPTGEATIQGGRLEIPANGVLLANIEGEVAAEGNALVLRRLTAGDGDAGRISLTGQALLRPPFDFEADAAIANAWLLRRPEASTRATGSAAFSGNATDMRLTGELTLDPTEVNIPNRLPPSVAEVTVIEVNDASGNRTLAKAPATAGPVIGLALNLVFPARFFVRGRGLDAEFAGNLDVNGTVSGPRISGDLSVVRGDFSFAGATFRLDQGTLLFQGGYPPDPLLNLRAVTPIPEGEAIFAITGPVSNFALELTSDPVLPRDEILSRVLFGRSLKTITPFQAYALLQAAAQLSGQDTGPNFVDQLRRGLHLDRLEVGQSDAGDTTVGAGKYLADDVYVKVEQDVEKGGQQVKVQIDLTPNLTLESGVGTNSAGGVGLKWKKDY